MAGKRKLRTGRAPLNHFRFQPPAMAARRMEKTISEATNIIMSSANLSGMVENNNVYKKKKKKKDNKPWFDNTCRGSRNKYNEAGNVYRNTHLDSDNIIWQNLVRKTKTKCK